MKWLLVLFLMTWLHFTLKSWNVAAWSAWTDETGPATAKCLPCGGLTWCFTRQSLALTRVHERVTRQRAIRSLDNRPCHWWGDGSKFLAIGIGWLVGFPPTKKDIVIRVTPIFDLSTGKGPFCGDSQDRTSRLALHSDRSWTFLWLTSWNSQSVNRVKRHTSSELMSKLRVLMSFFFLMFSFAFKCSLCSLLRSILPKAWASALRFWSRQNTIRKALWELQWLKRKSASFLRPKSWHPLKWTANSGQGALQFCKKRWRSEADGKRVKMNGWPIQMPPSCSL